ncbi:MAG TPA: response regulator transcription factor [Candidatus Methylomirabilis sp.]|nr:response regulator transcription factor [Candidatus Methylomirabilis sp.]
MGFPAEDATKNHLFSSLTVERLPLRILLVDSHQAVRQGLMVLLEAEGFKVVGEASDSVEGVRLAKRLCPEVAVLDRIVPPLDGIAAAREIRRESPQTRTMFLTMYTELPYILEALRAGVRGYVSKGEAAADLVPAIQNVAAGKFHLSPAIVDTIVQAYLTKADRLPDTLSFRQLEVLRLQAEGKSTKEIGALLGIGVKTVETHSQRTMQKLGIHDMASVVRYALGRDLLRLRSTP